MEKNLDFFISQYMFYLMTLKQFIAAMENK